MTAAQKGPSFDETLANAEKLQEDMVNRVRFASEIQPTILRIAQHLSEEHKWLSYAQWRTAATLVLQEALYGR